MVDNVWKARDWTLPAIVRRAGRADFVATTSTNANRRPVKTGRLVWIKWRHLPACARWDSLGWIVKRRSSFATTRLARTAPSAWWKKANRFAIACPISTARNANTSTMSARSDQDARMMDNAWTALTTFLVLARMASWECFASASRSQTAT